MAKDETILEELRERRTYAGDAWDPIHAEADADMRHVAGDPWDEKDRKTRKEAGRPCLSMDELGQYTNQVINDLRANPRGITFAPTGNGANDKGAKFYQNKTREIEYRSSAQIAYITAAENMIQRSYGWVRVRTKFAPKSFDQDLWIEPVMNPDNVLPDPDAIWPDSRDMKYLFYLESRLKKEFLREFPDATVRNFDGMQKIAPQWITPDKIQLAEYWAKETYPRTLLACDATIAGQPQQPLVMLYKDELKDGKMPAGLRVVREREDEGAKVMQYLTNGVEILKKTPWAGKYIPFVSCFGKVLFINGERQILSMVRLARDPYMLYCYVRTCEAETIGGIPKFPYFVYEGQLSPEQLQLLTKSVHEPVAVIKVKPSVDGAPGQLLALPQRQSWDPALAGLEAAAEAARRAIQAAMGISPMPTAAQRRNDKSGAALQQIESSGQKGSFHFVDHFEGMLQQTGVVLEDLMDKIHDTAKTLWVHEGDGTPKQTKVNDPNDPESVSTKGDYLVTVSTGPATESQRKEATGFVDTLVANMPMIAEVAGQKVAAAVLAKSIKLKDLGPIGEQMADLIEPPEFKTPDGKPPDPRLMAAQGQIQQLQQQLQQAGYVIQTKQVEGKTQYAIAKLKTDATSADKAADRAVKLDVAAIQAKIETMAMVLEELQRIGGLTSDASKRLHDAGQAALERHHATLEGAKDRLHEHIQGTLDHQRNLEVAAQAADLAPDPTVPTNGASA